MVRITWVRRWVFGVLCCVLVVAGGLCGVAAGAGEAGGVVGGGAAGTGGTGGVGHWAYRPAVKPGLPLVAKKGWVSNEIDRFVLARLEAAGLEPNEEADRRTLIRRLSFDLRGLPPTLEEVRRFVGDEGEGAYERLVDAFLSDAAYGEQMGRYWLDAARYGDTHGLHLDNYREMWPYRDWVIRAFNGNMGYDDFVTKQLAGDLLEEPTLDDLIATGFNRAHVSTNEGGSIEEEVYVRNVVDRTETFGTVMLGQTVGCAACHDHKYDPISMKDFYSLFAFFNSLDGPALDLNVKDPAPVVRVPSEEQKTRLAELRTREGEIERRMYGAHEGLDAAQREWERGYGERLAERWEVLEPIDMKGSGGVEFREVGDGSVLAGGANPEKVGYELRYRLRAGGYGAIRLEVMRDESLPHGGPGRSENANFVLSEFEAEVVGADGGGADVAGGDGEGKGEALKFRAATADHSQMGFDVAGAIDGDIKTGWAGEGHVKREGRVAEFVTEGRFGGEGAELVVRLRHESQYGRHAVGRVRISVSGDEELLAGYEPVRLGEWWTAGPFFPGGDLTAVHRAVVGPEGETEIDLGAEYADGDRKVGWVERVGWDDGEVHNTLEGEYSATYLYREIDSPTARRVELSLGSNDTLKVWVNGREVLDQPQSRTAAADQDKVNVVLRRGKNALVMKVSNGANATGFYFRKAGEKLTGLPAEVSEALSVAEGERSEAQRRAVTGFYRAEHWDGWAGLDESLRAARMEREKAEGEVATTLIWKERAEPRQAYLLKRGQYEDRGEEVGRSVPASMGAWDESWPRDRMGLAMWLTSGEHPLFARVAVNRFWQQLFGVGLVKTAEDLGKQGELPSHPGLLDWLAEDFVASGWDVKGLMKKMVMSAAYRQSAVVSGRKLEVDPENRLVSRGPRFRLDAEVLRDQALMLGGLLNREMGGPSVKPPQPEGLWVAVGYSGSNTVRFKADEGAKVYRRGVYTFWKRTASPPQLAMFDAPSRESCTVRRERTNTPLQALVLMNDLQHVEAARGFAQRGMLSVTGAGAGDGDGGDNGGESVASDRAAWLFEVATAREPDAMELATLLGLYRDQLAVYRGDIDAARKLLAVGDSPADKSLDAAELAAWTMVCNLILNLDEVVTKG